MHPWITKLQRALPFCRRTAHVGPDGEVADRLLVRITPMREQLAKWAYTECLKPDVPGPFLSVCEIRAKA